MFFDPSKAPWRRINVRLALWHSGVAFTTILAVLLLTYFALRARVEEQDRDVVHFRLNQYAGEYRRGGMEGVIALAAFRKGRAQKAFFIRIATASNETLYERDAEDWVEFSPEKLTKAKVPEGEEIEWITLPSPHGYGLLIAGIRLSDGIIVQVGKATEESYALLQQYRMITLMMLLISIPASVAAGTFLAGRALQPLRDLTHTVRDIEETAKFSMRTPVSGAGDEIDELAVVFNSAMERIEGLLRTMRESLDNVAHDLRTPMTRLRNRAQLCLESEADPKAQQEALIGCVEESDRVLEMLDTLMDIAEAEAGLTRIPSSPVNLASVVANACDLYTEVAEDRGVNLRAQVPEDLSVPGDRILISRAIANLLDNALKYTPVGGTVRITGRRQNGAAEISVADNGMGIPPEDLPKVWQRLFRGDKSRSERGLGLGLSFVKAIVQAHGGTATAESVPGSGATFTVRLPLKKPVAQPDKAGDELPEALRERSR